MSPNSNDISKCPVMGQAAPENRHTANGALSTKDWWPNQLNLSILHQNSAKSNPLGDEFSYKEAFEQLDLEALKADINEVMTTSQDWWPADYGHYGPFFIRMAWHSAGTYRATDGRGGACDGTQRFAPLNSWPDNGNLDKARRLLWPLKQKYGQKISWADLMILAGNCAIESMGGKILGFAGGREDVWEPQEDVFWGAETEWMGVNRYDDEGNLNSPLAASHMGLIYVNPEGVDGVPEPLASAAHIRETFGNMSMNDEETVALIAGGHTFGKCHGAADPDEYVGAEPESAPLEEMGFGWKSSYKSGKGGDTITSGLEGAWTQTPAAWSNGYFKNLFEYEWELTKSPAGAHQWTAKDGAGAGTIPDAHDPEKTHAPFMLTTDIALIVDPEYKKISEHFYKNPEALREAFAAAWYKLVHRDLGPTSCSIGNDFPEAKIWQDPLPKGPSVSLSADAIQALKDAIKASGLSVSELVKVAWASASTFRGSDKRGDANGGRIRLAPQKDWAVNEPEVLAKVLEVYRGIQAESNGQGIQVSMADLIVLGGGVGIEIAAKNAGLDLEVPFDAGRVDTTQELTDVDSFKFLEPKSDGFRNYLGTEIDRPAPENLLDKAQLLGLTAPEMTALVGGLRVLNTTVGMPALGLFTETPEQLTNDYFKNLLSMENEWKQNERCEHFYEGRDNAGEVKWYATSVDLVFGSNSQLRGIAEVYGSEDGVGRFVSDFIDAWVKVMNADRFDLV